MQIRKEIVNGKKRMIITKTASGEDKSREVILRIMGPGWKFEDSNKKVEA